MTDLRDKVARAIEAALLDECGVSGAAYLYQGKLYQDYDDTVPLTQIADAIDALYREEYAEALALKAEHEAILRDVLSGHSITRITADGKRERVDPADVYINPSPPSGASI